MAETEAQKAAQGDEPSRGDVRKAERQAAANIGPSTPQSLRDLAEDLPERDAVQRAHKDALLADSAQADAKAKARIVEESPDAADTPSGGAVVAVAGVSNDTERAERYDREKTARRRGYVPVDES